MGLNTFLRSVLVSALLAPAASHAQVVLDGSLGAGGALAGPAYAIPASAGRQVGANLFHSFSAFNLSAGQSATFSGPGGTANVISRVTGGSPSSIDGTVRSTIPGANVYLFNPRGMVFGPNARLDVGGSFHASTATHLNLGGGGRFDAANPSASVLTAAAPAAFGFAGPRAPLTVDRSRLWVPAGSSLSLSAGDLTVRGAGIASGIPTLWAPGGTLELSADATTLQGAIAITERAGAAPGPIFIRGGRLTMDASALSTRNARPGAGADLTIELSGDLALDRGSFLRSSAVAGGDAGDMRIRAANVRLAGQSVIETSSIDLAAGLGGRAGVTDIAASGEVALSGGSAITSITLSGAAAGEMRIRASALSLSEGASLNASTFGDGAAGRVLVEVDDLRLASGGRFLTGSLFDSNVAPGTGAGGDIVVRATRGVDITGAGSGLFSTTESFGPGGAIDVAATWVRLADGGRISAESADPNGFGAVGDAGSIAVSAAHSILLENGGAITTASATAGGGIITLRAGQLLGLTRSRITTSVADGSGNGGDINIDPVFVTLNESQIIAQAVGGNGGDITIETQFLLVSPGSLISASSQFGLDGQVLVTSPEVDVGTRLAVLPGAYVDASTLLRESCAARAGRASSSFVGAGRGGLPAGPESAASPAPAFAGTPARAARSFARSLCAG